MRLLQDIPRQFHRIPCLWGGTENFRAVKTRIGSWKGNSTSVPVSCRDFDEKAVENDISGSR
jgi:hypothetical protein